MKKTISLFKFIIIQSLIMISIFGLYLFYIYPQIKPGCTKTTLCSQAFDCECNLIDDLCNCKYIDENNFVRSNLKCPNPNKK